MRIVWPVLVSAAVCAASAAQPREQRQRPAAPRDDAFKMVEAYVLSNMQDSLGLSEAQFVKLLPLVKTHQAERRAAMQRRNRALMELRRGLQSGRATEASVKDLLDELKQAEADAPAVVQRNQKAIDDQLTPLQQAKYRVFEAEVERKVRELLRSAVRGRAMDRRERRPDEGWPDPEP